VLGSLAENVKVADVEAVVPDGPESIVVCGATLSTFHVRVSGLGSTLPALSSARTSNVCEPLLSDVYDFGELHACQARPLSLHCAPPGSVAVK
jgi:hypothetical protein